MSKKPVDYKQFDNRWGKEPYSNHNDPRQTIATSGSGPTLCADIIATLIDETVTPVTLAKLALDLGCRTYSCGTAWSFFSKVAAFYEFPKFVQSAKWEALKECIDAGGYVVCNMTSGYWCRTSNYILAWDYDEKYVYAVDASSTRRHKQKIDDFKAQSRTYFCFYPIEKEAIDT